MGRPALCGRGRRARNECLRIPRCRAETRTGGFGGPKGSADSTGRGAGIFDSRFALCFSGVPGRADARHADIVRGTSFVRTRFLGKRECSGMAGCPGREPLHPSAPEAARRDGRLYEILALIDALREGRNRERQIAKEELLKRIHRI